MGFLDPNALIGTFHGKIGSIVLVRRQDGKVIVKSLPERKAPFRPGELSNQSRFAKASAYVKSAKQRPELYPVYQMAAKLKGKRACDLAFRDSWYGPVIADVDLSGYTGRAGESIWIEARDDFEVVSASVCIRDLGGTVIEEGVALFQSGSIPKWLYLSRAEVPAGNTVVIEVTAVDRPGNTARKSFDHACGPRPH